MRAGIVTGGATEDSTATAVMSASAGIMNTSVNAGIEIAVIGSAVNAAAGAGTRRAASIPLQLRVPSSARSSQKTPKYERHFAVLREKDCRRKTFCGNPFICRIFLRSLFLDKYHAGC
ncbi:hypothetical protein HMPREF9555_00720 [Selenomonas artemidis F0399]|uniref:Uncharacterized protein n=1 Tax=Selenomonas artemidis F0399 TaxID=749551 RepID=E7N169_9FIRM|nr:hypothetical protein HMPREF9555_00720 [Selenomonas artemidis F0399]